MVVCSEDEGGSGDRFVETGHLEILTSEVNTDTVFLIEWVSEVVLPSVLCDSLLEPSPLPVIVPMEMLSNVPIPLPEPSLVVKSVGDALGEAVVV